MKKIISVLVSVVAMFAFSFCLTACSSDQTEGGGKNKGTLYSVQAPKQSDIYTVTGLPEGAYEGDTVTFKVALTHPVDSVLNYVELSGTATGSKKLDPVSEGTYSFSMPAEPVTVSVSADYYPDNDTDNFLSWEDSTALSVEKWQAAFEGDAYYDFSDDVLLTSLVTSQPSQSPANFALTKHTERAFSLNQAVIPDDALTVDVKYRDGNQANQFIVRIDRSKISAGTAKIVLIVENNSKFGDKAVLARTVTVTEPQALLQVETWSETVVFDISAIENDADTEKMAFVFEDLDYQADMYLQHTQMFDVKDYEIKDGKITLTFVYAVGHDFEISFHFYMSVQPASPSIRFENTVDGADYSAGKLTFTKENGSIELIVE